MALKNLVPAKFSLPPDEKADLEALAVRTGKTFAELIRALVAGRQPLAVSNKHLLVRDLMKINADLARLGNLLKLILDDDGFVLPAGMDFPGLYDSIRATQSELKSKIREL